MQNKIFISCSSKDSKAALAICDAIEARGYACWLASRDVGPGQNFQIEIVRAIRTAPLMILVFSSNADNSNEIKKEVAVASQNNLTVIPVRIEDVAPSEAFIYELATRQWIDVFGDWERSMRTLLQHIAAVMPAADSADASLVAQNTPKPVVDLKIHSPLQGAPAPQNISAAESPSPQKRISSRQRQLLIAVGLVVVAAVGGGLLWNSDVRRSQLAAQAPENPPMKGAALQERPAAPPQTSSPTPTGAPAMDAATIETNVWKAVEDSKDAGALRSYLDQYPKGMFAGAARAKIAALNKPAPIAKAALPAQAVAAPLPAPTTSVAGKVFGPQNRDARVVLRIHSPTHIMVHGPDGRKYIDYDLNMGDSYLVPNNPGLTLTTLHAAAVEIDLDGKAMGLAGPDMQAVDGFSIDPQAIVDRFNPSPAKPQSAPANTASNAPGPGNAAAAPQANVSGASQFELAMNLLSRAKYDEAKAAFRAYADANPGDKDLSPQAIYWVGNIDYLNRDYQNAASAFAEQIKNIRNLRVGPIVH